MEETQFTDRQYVLLVNGLECYLEELEDDRRNGYPGKDEVIVEVEELFSVIQAKYLGVERH